MKRLVLTVLAVAFGSAAHAQAPEPATPAKAPEAATAATERDDFQEGELTLGFVQKDVSTLSSKFEEYRDVPNGIAVPSLRFFGRRGALRYDFRGERVRQEDQHYGLRLWSETFEVRGDYRQIPHRFGNAGHTILQNTGPGVWAISDTLQGAHQGALVAAPPALITFPFLDQLLAPSLAAANVVDLGLQRECGNLSVRLAPRRDLDVSVSYFHERRVGDRSASGTSFGFGNVVELPEPLHYLTQDIGADGEYTAKWGSVRAGLHYNWFEDRIDSLAFDNPFRVTDSTDPSAYTGPAAASIGGAAYGRVALPPDNDALTGSLAATVKLPARSRLNLSVSRAHWNQNRTPFIAYSTNTAIVTPFVATDLSQLPAQKLDGQIDVTSLAASMTSHPADHVGLTLRYRSYEQDNQTPRLTFPGYVRFDAVFEDIARVSVPYGFKNQRFDGTLDYDLGKLSVEGGYRHIEMDRTYRETEATTENILVLAADVRPFDGGILRGSWEHGSRDFEGYEAERSEDASFVTPGPPVNLFALPGNLRFDQAPRDSDRLLATLQLSPGDKTTLVASYGRHKDDYDQSTLGLIEASFDTLTLEADFQPTERINLNAYWTWEKLRNFQRGRQSGATPSTNPLDDWTSTVGDKSQSLGGGADFTLVPAHWFLGFSGWYQKVDGDNALFSPPGGAPALARSAVGGVQSLPIYDDTRIVSVNAELRDEFAKNWSAALGAWYEDYVVRDSNTQGLANYVPGSLFLAANDGDYRAWVGYVRVTRRF